jgi:hypothetical protein
MSNVELRMSKEILRKVGISYPLSRVFGCGIELRISVGMNQLEPLFQEKFL